MISLQVYTEDPERESKPSKSAKGSRGPMMLPPPLVLPEISLRDEIQSQQQLSHSLLANQLSNGLKLSKKRLDSTVPDNEPPAKKGAFAVQPSAPALEASKEPAQPPTRQPTTENPFMLQGRREQMLKLFLRTERACWNAPPAPFRARGPTEDLDHYAKQRKSYYNQPQPKIVNIINLFIPSVVRHNNCGSASNPTSSNAFLAPLAPAHLETLNKIYQWHHAPAWKGLMALFPWTSMECIRYDFDFQDQIHPSASVLEAHRRALQLERVCHDLTDYLCRSMSKIEHMYGFTKQHLERCKAAITAGSGLFGWGSNFWEPAPKSLQAVERITKVNDCCADEDMAKQVKWLQENRTAAFTRSYTVTTELDWGVPMLALCFKHQAALAHLDESEKAEAMLKVFKDETNERIKLYIMDLEPLLLYGGRLTRYVADLYALCSTHFSILGRIPGSKHVLSFPNNCKLLTVNSEGQLIGRDGQPTPGGHLALPEASLSDGDSRPPFPFPEACCQLCPNEAELQRLTDDRRAKEERRLQDMLQSLFNSADDTKTVSVMRTGKHNALRRLREDSHQARLTVVFPPTASMPGAVYAPEQLFKV